MRRAISALEIGVFSALCLGAGAFVIAARSRTHWDQDIWWHLRTGQWIAEHGQVPVIDPFSQYGQGKAWIAYSWLFDAIAHGAFHSLGLRGLVLLSAVLGLLIAAALYVLLRELEAPLAVAVTLTLVGFDAMMPLTTPRPWLFSMLFFLIELTVIVHVEREAAMEREASAERKRSSRALWLLPPLFIVWANVHVQFLIGLVVLVAAAVDALWERRPAATWLLMTALCAAAALVNPYHIGVYTAARELMAQTELWTRIGELLAPDFRQSTDWITLGLTLTAAGVIGWQFLDAWHPIQKTWGPPSGGPTPRRSPRVFLLLIFAFGVYFGFKSRRDTWLTITASACAIAAAPWDTILRRRESAQFPGWLGAAIAAALGVVLPLTTAGLLSEDKLAANVARTYPAAAAAFVEQRALAGPLYNYFDWGGYLMWRLPQLPVQMDGRTIVHGQPRILTHVDTWQGKPAWRADPELAAAKTIIGPRDLPLASLLRLDDRFRLVYEDRDGPAVVFEAR
jgi:hypothetical protein